MTPEKQVFVRMDAKELAAFNLGQEVARREAYEDAARIAENAGIGDDSWGEHIAAAIRARASEGK
jgi:hypothetical protein